MAKKILCLVIAGLMLAETAVSANSGSRETPIYMGESRYLFFATEGGRGVDYLNLPYGTRVDLNEYIPEKDGFEFEGWYDDPIEKVNRLSEIVLEENTVVWAKWMLREGMTQRQLELEIIAREVIGNNVVFLTADNEVKIVPVTDLWAARNTRLEMLMKIHNKIFN